VFLIALPGIFLINERGRSMKIKHKFQNHQINSDTEILIIGTFNPDVQGNEADFFYGRGRNYLWSLLPRVFGENSLKGKGLREKYDFMKKYKIDFVDLINQIEVKNGQGNNYSDNYIDSRVTRWKNIINIIENGKIKKVYFTRKTFSGISNIKTEINQIKDYCIENNIKFRYLPTPARFKNEDKLNQWKKAFGK